jgi:hypothetical protein
MEEHLIHKANAFNPTVSNVDFKPVGFGAGGFGTAMIMYHKSSINIQTHQLTSPFGYSDGFGDKKDPNVQFNLYTSNPDDAAFIKGMKQLEDLIVQTAFDRRVEWRLFNNRSASDNATLEQVRAKFNTVIKPGKGDYPPTFKASFMKDRSSGEVNTPCYDHDNKPIVPSPGTIPRRSRNMVDLQAKTVWISNDGKFGIKWNIQKLQVFPPKESQDQRQQYVPKPAFSRVTPLAQMRSPKEDDDEGELIDDDSDIVMPKMNLPSGKCLLRDEDDE